MATIKADKMKKALNKKGFVLSNSGRHERYIFFHNGKKSSVFTELSHGSHGKEDIRDKLIGNITKQLRFDERRQLHDFVDCKISQEDYTIILLNKGLLKDRVEA